MGLPYSSMGSNSKRVNKKRLGNLPGGIGPVEPLMTPPPGPPLFGKFRPINRANRIIGPPVDSQVHRQFTKHVRPGQLP